MLRIDLDDVAIRGQHIDPRKTGLAAGILPEPPRGIRGAGIVAQRLEVLQRPAIAANADREVNVVRVDCLPVTKGRLLADDEVEVPIAERVPRARTIERGTWYLRESEHVTIERLRARKVGDGEAHVMDRLDLKQRHLLKSQPALLPISRLRHHRGA